MPAPNGRKRATPGGTPAAPYQQRVQQQLMADSSVGVGDPMMRWTGSADGTDLVDAAPHTAGQYGLVAAPSQFGQGAPTPSNSLTRRPMNQALVPANPRANYDVSAESWPGFGDEGSALLQQGSGEGLAEQDSIDVLEEMAQKAKREAQSNRKQIAPFVQKLRSFLEDRKNEGFIRWSEKGDSFVVLDEDEFAKTLIPELFKHNNYASFVRQLNMYGFHKRVGLSDNSMRASERKNKSPSEYYNPFFRRGHPNLLWLINKPKSGSKGRKGGKSAEGEADSDEDAGHEETPGQGPSTSNASAGRSLPAAESPPLQKKEMALIKDELHKVREQQKMILGAITQLQRNNNELYNQALMFQNQHDRHQNSINAILNFLANVFRKTLEDGSHQNVGDIISSMMTNQAGQQPHHQGSVFDLGDLVQSSVDAGASPMAGAHKRARGLLPPIPNQSDATKVRSPPSTAGTPLGGAAGHNPEMGHVTELFDQETPPNLRQELETNPQERMMRIIHDHNATNASGMDLPQAAKLVANTPSTLNQDQQSKLVDLMSRQASQSPAWQTPQSPAATGRTRAPQQAASFSGAAGAGPSASPSPGAGAAAPSLSPIMRSPTMQPPSLTQINANQIDLDQLQRLQTEQDTKIHELSEMLGPLSPSGHVPGIGDGNEAYFDAPNMDLDQYFDSNAFLNDAHFGGDGNDFNFGIDGHEAQNAAAAAAAAAATTTTAGEIQTQENTPSPTGTEEIERDDPGISGTGGGDDRSNKRRRMG